MRKSKLLLMILALVVVLAMVVACGNDEDDSNDDNGPISTAPPTGGSEVTTPDPEPDVPAGPAAIPRPGGLVYSLATDQYVQHAGVGVQGHTHILSGEVNYLQNAGNPTWNTVESPLGGVGFRLSNREYDWNGADIRIPVMNVDLDNNAYLLTVTGRVVGGGEAALGGADGPHAVFVTADVADDFVLSLVVDAELRAGAGSRGYIRIRTVDNTNDLYVYAITLTNYIPTEENVVYQLSADPFVQFAPDGARNDFALESPNLMSAGSPTYTIVAGPYGNAISVTNRDANYHAVDLIYIASGGANILGVDLENNTYLLTVRGNITGGGTFIIGGADSPWGWLANEATDGDFEVTFEMTYDSVYGIGDYDGTGSGGGGRRNFRLAADGFDDFVIHEIIVVRQ